MGSTETISSLYGPGTVTCWLCTVTSVFISWSGNVKSRRRDTISNDLIATVSFPAIASGHFLHSAIRTAVRGLPDEEIPVASMNAALCICVLYSIFGTLLICISGCGAKLRRWSCAWSTTVFSIVPVVVVLALGYVPGTTFQAHPIQYYTMILIPTFMIVPVGALTYDAYNKYSRILDQVPIRECRLHLGYLVACFAFCILELSLLTLAFWRASHLPMNQQTMRDIAVQIFPLTPYSFADLDQAVALSGGILTLLFSFRDMHVSWHLASWEDLEEWRYNCAQFLERKDLEEGQARRWREQLRTIDDRIEHALRNPERVDVQTEMDRHYQKSLVRNLKGSGYI